MGEVIGIRPRRTASWYFLKRFLKQKQDEAFYKNVWRQGHGKAKDKSPSEEENYKLASSALVWYFFLISYYTSFEISFFFLSLFFGIRQGAFVKLRKTYGDDAHKFVLDGTLLFF